MSYSRTERIDNTRAPQTPVIRIAIADDHKLIVDGVEEIFRSEGIFTTTAVYDLPQLLTLLERQPFDIVLLDLNMPSMNGIESIDRVVRAAGEANVVLFTGQIDKHFLDKALEHGVRGLILKTMPLRSIASVVELIHAGQVFVPIDASSLAATHRPNAKNDLNEKETQTLRLASDGMTNKEIARTLGMTEVIVKMHMRAICKKLGARNRVHAAIIGRERSLF